MVRPLVKERVRTLLTVGGVALGVAVVVAIRLGNVGSLAGFREAADLVNGRAAVTVTGVTGAFPEDRLADLGWLREFGIASPVLQCDVYLSDQPETRAAGDVEGVGGGGEYVRVLGIDLLADRELRDYRVVGEPSAVEDAVGGLIRRLQDPESVLLSAPVATERGWAVGQRLRLSAGEAARPVRVAGILEPTGPAGAMVGRFGIMDIAAAQVAFDRLGWVDRLDVRLREGLAIDDAIAAIRGRLPADLVVEESASRLGRVESMIAAFHFNLDCLGSVALLVGIYMIYNTLSLAVLTRRSEIGMLRAIGAGPRMILLLILTHGMALTIAGTLVGLLLGQGLGYGAMALTTATVQTFYLPDAATAAATTAATWWVGLGAAFAWALPLGLAASAWPAWRACAVGPLEAIRDGLAPPLERLPIVPALGAAGGLTAAGFAATYLPVVADRPVFGYLAALAFVLAASLLAPAVVLALLGLVRRLLVPRLGRHQGEGLLVCSNLQAALPRLWVAIAALAVALAMMIAITLMVGSFRQTLLGWIDRSLAADLYVRPADRGGPSARRSLSAETLATLAARPEVATVIAPIFREIVVDDAGRARPATLVATDLGQLAERSDTLALKEPSSLAAGQAALRAAAAGDGVLVTESFALRCGLRLGDNLHLPTERGPVSFRIEAIYRDYADNRGRVMLDRAALRRYWPDLAATWPASLAMVFLKPDAGAVATVRQALQQAFPADSRLVFATNQEVSAAAVAIFEQTFSITYALQAIALTIAGLGIVSSLVTLIHDRRREFAVLSFLGAAPGQIRRVILGEAVVIALAAQTVGVTLGIALSLLLIEVINVQSFGWTIEWHLPVGFLVTSTMLLVAVAGLAGWHPASRAARLDAVRYVGDVGPG